VIGLSREGAERSFPALFLRDHEPRQHMAQASSRGKRNSIHYKDYTLYNDAPTQLRPANVEMTRVSRLHGLFEREAPIIARGYLRGNPTDLILKWKGFSGSKFLA
jgi:hypothetical protein